MRIDVLELGLGMLGANEERRSLGATEALLVNQVMARVNATFRRYSETRDMFARFELAVFLTEIEELIVLAERLVARSTDVASAFQAVGRQILTEFVRHAGTLAQATIDELLQELAAAGRRRIPAFAGRIKQLGLIYVFATRFDEPAVQAPLHDLSASLYRLMENLAREVVSRLKAALVLNELSAVRDHAEQIAAMHELARDVGWDELGGRLLGELRNHVVADPSLRNLFVAA
jgi:serine/threonine-protein kinase